MSLLRSMIRLLGKYEAEYSDEQLRRVIEAFMKTDAERSTRSPSVRRTVLKPIKVRATKFVRGGKTFHRRAHVRVKPNRSK